MDGMYALDRGDGEGVRGMGMEYANVILGKE